MVSGTGRRRVTQMMVRLMVVHIRQRGYWCHGCVVRGLLRFRVKTVRTKLTLIVHGLPSARVLSVR